MIRTGGNARRHGFTIVELLVVIVVIAILAAITIVAFNGIQARARDSQRKSDVKVIAKALEMYYIDKGNYPSAGPSTAIGNGWATTADTSWDALGVKLKPYLAKLPYDPISTPDVNVRSTSGTYDYAYMSYSYCGTTGYQMYLLVYRLEGANQENSLSGDCPVGTEGYSVTTGTISNYRVVK
jgi:general secretion pathway protein G